jgi:hypothetical protein
MAVGTLSRVGAKNAAEVCKRFDIGAPATALLKPEHTPDRYLDVLVEQKQWPAAIQFLAHAMPKPEAVWWTCLSARAAAGATPSPAIKAALDAAEKWLVDPSETNRQAAFPAAQAAGLATPAGSAALAAFISGGSIGPSHVPPVPPGENMTGQIAGAGVLMAAVQNDPAKAIEKFQAFLAKGVEVARGTNRWPARR